MSAFSEEIRQEIKKSGKTLLYLSGASGLSLDHISKMRMGKRLPQDEKKIKELIKALECPERTGKKLFSLYKMEKMGKTEWACIEETKRLLETWKYPDKKSLMPFFVLPETKDGAEKDNAERDNAEKVNAEGDNAKRDNAGRDSAGGNRAVLNSRSEICGFFMSVMGGEWQCSKEQRQLALYMMTGDMPPELVNVLAAAGGENQWTFVHWFSLLRNTEPEAALYNIRVVSHLLPLLQKEEQYIPYFDYGEKKLPMDMNWIVGEEWALGLDEEMESGLVIRDRVQVEYLRDRIRTKCKNGRKLLEYLQKEYSQKEQPQKEHTQKKYPQKEQQKEQRQKEHPQKEHLQKEYPPRDTAKGEEMLLREGGEKKAYGLSPFPYPVVWSQKEGKAACFFTEEGLKRFLDGEDLPSFFNQNALPLLRERKMELVKRYIERLERGEEPCRLLDSTKFSPAFGHFWYLEDRGPGCSFCVCVSERKGSAWIIREMGISERILRLMEFVEAGEFLLSRQEGIRKIRHLLQLV